MATPFEVLGGIASAGLAVAWLRGALKVRSLEKSDAEKARRLLDSDSAVAAAKKEAADAVADASAAKARVQVDAKDALAKASKRIEDYLLSLADESERVRKHYEGEARSAAAAFEARATAAESRLVRLARFESMADAEAQARKELAAATETLTLMKARAETVLAEAQAAAEEDKKKASEKATTLVDQATKALEQARSDAGRIIEEANRRAEAVAADAHRALRERESLEAALKAVRNVVDGYGDKYLIPTRSLIDDLASDFGHMAAGESLRAAREVSRRMVENGEAAACEYSERNRKETAIRFVVDAFNGRVDAILARAKSDNLGTLTQEVQDAFALVELNGQAFRNARILPAYLDARLAELKWAVAVQELKQKEREEQRALQEQMREEEKRRREVEKALKDAAEDEERLKAAMERARAEVESASAQERALFEEKLKKLGERLAEAEAKKERAKSMAEQTRSGHVYVISNVGSFGDDVFKIGMTRRLEPMDRVKELGDASVPFEFDVHALIQSNDAPTLERALHEEFHDLRLNKVNFRKEFFRLSIHRLREVVVTKQLAATFTMVAEAREYRETQALEKMSPEERRKYELRAETGPLGDGE